MEESLLTMSLHPPLNATLLTLIPKIGDLENDGFSLIGLYSIIYKLISSVIVNRLNPILWSLISPTQTRFVKGWQIADGIIVTQEIIHSLKSTNMPGMLIKHYFSKKYDRMSSNYLFQVLSAYGFSGQWIWWVSSLVSTMFFSILINGSPSNTFSS